MNGCHTNAVLCILSSVLAIFAKDYLENISEGGASRVLQPWSLESKLGDHVIMEITAASPSLLDSVDGLHDAVKTACEKANLTIVAIKTHKFSPQVMIHMKVGILKHTTEYITSAYLPAFMSICLHTYMW